MKNITLYLVTFSYSRVLEYKETDTAALIRFYNDVLNVEKKVDTIKQLVTITKRYPQYKEIDLF